MFNHNIFCWGGSINRKSLDGLLMHTERAHYDTFPKDYFISYMRISHVKRLVSIDTYVWTLKTFPGILLLECQDIEGITDISSRVLWHFMTISYECKEHTLIRKYSLVQHRMVIPFNTIEEQYKVTGNLSCLSFSCSYLSKRLIRRVVIHFSVFMSP